jgi:hypothetical protein
MVTKSNTRDLDYSEGCKFFIHYWRVIAPREGISVASVDPIKVIAEAEAHSKTMAKKGLSQALADIVEMHSHSDPDLISRMDQDLKKNGIMTISDLRFKYSRKISKIVKIGAIKTETEYYLIRSVMDSDVLTATQRNELAKMLSAYEATLVLKPKR